MLDDTWSSVLKPMQSLTKYIAFFFHVCLSGKEQSFLINKELASYPDLCHYDVMLL